LHQTLSEEHLSVSLLLSLSVDLYLLLEPLDFVYNALLLAINLFQVFYCLFVVFDACIYWHRYRLGPSEKRHFVVRIKPKDLVGRRESICVILFFQ
jgi:hypothetical protein